VKRGLVTGGSEEIGAAICRRLARMGMHVLVHAGHNRPRAAEVASEIETDGGSAQALSFDITDAEQTRDILAEYAAQTPIHVVVNNAGVHDDAPMAGMSHAQWLRVVDVCLNGFFNITQPLLLPMIQTRWGRIMNISSVAGVMGNRGQTNYAAAKAGLHGATKSLAKELASRGITVNAVAPGVIATRMSKDVFDTETIKRLVPMKRAGCAGEVAALVGFLASEEAASISGQIISIDGAMA